MGCFGSAVRPRPTGGCRDRARECGRGCRRSRDRGPRARRRTRAGGRSVGTRRRGRRLGLGWAHRCAARCRGSHAWLAARRYSAGCGRGHPGCPWPAGLPRRGGTVECRRRCWLGSGCSDRPTPPPSASSRHASRCSRMPASLAAATPCGGRLSTVRGGADPFRGERRGRRGSTARFADVVVTDGFTGNAVLKAIEGTVDLVVSRLDAALPSARERDRGRDSSGATLRRIIVGVDGDRRGRARRRNPASTRRMYRHSPRRPFATRSSRG